MFAAGDQPTYLKDWKGTKLQTAAQTAINNCSVPIGGTSACCDIQQYFVYRARNGSTTSVGSLLDPFIEYISYSLSYNTIVDTHFVTRDTFGRLLTFVARLGAHSNIGSGDGHVNTKVFNINEQTAISIDLETIISATIGLGPFTSAEYILLPEVKTLSYKDVTVQKLHAYSKDTFDFQIWKGGVKDLNHTTVENGILRNYPHVPLVARQLRIVFKYFSFIYC